MLSRVRSVLSIYDRENSPLFMKDLFLPSKTIDHTVLPTKCQPSQPSISVIDVDWMHYTVLFYHDSTDIANGYYVISFQSSMYLMINTVNLAAPQDFFFHIAISTSQTPYPFWEVAINTFSIFCSLKLFIKKQKKKRQG